MERTARRDKAEYMRLIPYGVMALVLLFPLLHAPVLDRGIFPEWVARMEELAEGIRLFPTIRVYQTTGIQDNALNSNLFFLGSALLLRLTGKVALAYRATMLLLQLCTILTAKVFFEAYYGHEEWRATVMGTVLYVTCPYRVFLSYGRGDLSMAFAWAFLPIYAWAILRLRDGSKQDEKTGAGKDRLAMATWKYALFGALALAGMGYSHFVIFGAAMVLTLLWALYGKKPVALLTVAGGCVLCAPGVLAWIRLAFTGAYDEWGLIGRTIMPNGYRLGEYFSSYVFREGRPGMGIGLLIGLGALIWDRFVEGKKMTEKSHRFFLLAALLLTVLSFHSFPWEWVQRLGSPFLKLVGAIQTPASFWGVACGCLCVPACDALRELSEGKAGETIRGFAMTACLLLCIYQCNM